VRFSTGERPIYLQPNLLNERQTPHEAAKTATVVKISSGTEKAPKAEQAEHRAPRMRLDGRYDVSNTINEIFSART
jgi:hypothetical protein